MSRPTIAIWGVGLIGGSLGMAWRRAGLAREVIGLDPAPQDQALRLGAIDRWAADAEEALAQADLLVLAAPVGAIVAQAAALGPRVRPGTVVTDVASVKRPVAEAWERHLAPGAYFVGGHPMFGREVSGVTNASANLVAGCRWVLTPGSRSDETSVAMVRWLAEGIGAHVITMEPVAHDRCAAAASHLPQVSATALAAAALEMDPDLTLAAGGFRDTTRIAESPAGLWRAILLANAGPVREGLGRLRQLLDQVDEAVASGDGDALEALFAQGQAARRRFHARQEEAKG